MICLLDDVKRKKFILQESNQPLSALALHTFCSSKQTLQQPLVT